MSDRSQISLDIKRTPWMDRGQFERLTRLPPVNPIISSSRSPSLKSPLPESSRQQDSGVLLQEQQVLLVNKKDGSFYQDPLIQKFLPYAPITTTFDITKDQQNEFIFYPEAAHLTSWVKNHDNLNKFRRVYRKLGHTIYSIPNPPMEYNVYPSEHCEKWAQEILYELDQLMVFKPNCLVTRKHLATVCPEDNPAYGAFYLTLIQLRNSVVGSTPPEVPLWPQADCMFTAPAFEVAAVLFRDEVECFITWIYQHVLECSNPSSPAHSEELTVQAQPSILKDLEEATLQPQGEVTMVKPTGKRKSVSPVQAVSVPLPMSRAPSNQPSLRDSPIPLSPKVVSPPSARSLELPTINVLPHNLGQLMEEDLVSQERTAILLQRQIADSGTPYSSPESTIQRLIVPNLDIPDTPFRPLSAAESFLPPSASSTPRIISKQPTPYRYSSTANSQGSQSMSIDEPTVVRRTELVELEEIMDSSQELSISPSVLAPPVVSTPEDPSGYTIHNIGPSQAWLPNSVQPNRESGEVAQPESNMEQLNSPDSIRMEERPELQIANPTSLAESLSSVSSVSTQSTRVTQAPLLQSTPRHVTISEEFLPIARQPSWPRQGNSLRDVPLHAEFVTRRTLAATW
jgi:hypothetical protein